MDILKARADMILGKTIYDMNLRVADYGRVSTDKDDQVNSLENQVKYFSDMIDSVKSWVHVRSYADEGISGTQVFKREEFLKMIEDARLGKIDLILTKEVSRFARNTIDSISYTQLLLKYGVIVYFISDNINTIYPDSEFRLTLMASMAQDEVRKLSERVKFGIKRSIKDGKVGGGGIYGYTKKDCTLSINQNEAPAVIMLYNLYSTGKYGFRKIAELMADEGYYTRKGKIFSDITLKKMLKNPRYKGWYTASLSEVEDYKTHKKKMKPKEEWVMYKDESGRIPAIVDEELWDKANNIYEERTKAYNRNVLNQQFYLENRKYTSKIFCLEHNTTFIRSASCKRKDNPVWQCNEFLRHGIKGCETPRLYEKHLDKIFIDILEDLVQNTDEIFNSIIKDYTKLIKDSNNSLNINVVEEKIQEKNTFKERLFDMSLRKMISDDEFVEKNNKINDEIKELQKEKVKLSNDKENPDYFKSIIDNIKSIIKPKMDIKENLGEYFNLFVDKVMVSKIDNNRKHIKLQVIFNFKKNDNFMTIDYTNKNDINVKKLDENEGVINDEKLAKPVFTDNFLEQKYLLSIPHQSGFR